MILRRQLKRRYVLAFFQKQTRHALGGIEACDARQSGGCALACPRSSANGLRVSVCEPAA